MPKAGIRALKLASNSWDDIAIDPQSWFHRIRRSMERIFWANAEQLYGLYG